MPKPIHIKDIHGKRFGRLIVTGTVYSVKTIISGGKKRNLKYITCKCDCGSEKLISVSGLTNGTKSCGCLQKEKVASINSKDLVGKKFKLLTVIKQCKNPSKHGRVSRRQNYWFCVCTCGGTVVATTNELTTRNTKSCGCLRKLRGKAHHRWKISKTHEERLVERKYSEYYEWRDEVYNRDQHTCLTCSKIGGNLNAHHLNGYNKFIDQRLDVANGVTLCEKCHSKFHSIYGKGNNTKQQFEEFSSKRHK